MAKRYNLRSEIQSTKAKFPPFELQLPAVPHEGENAPEGNLYEERVVQVPAMQLMPDEVMLYINTQPVRAARMVLGDAYDHYVASGGTANLLFTIVQTYQGADMGE